MIKDSHEYSILIIEDNPGDFMLVEDFLMEQMTHPKITQAINFKAAAEHSSNSFDVVLLDLSLPDKSRESLVEAIQKLFSNCPVIIFTGYADTDFSKRSISRNIADYLLKDELTGPILYKSIIYAIERNKHITELKISEKRYSDLFRLSPQPMWVYDPETYRFLQVNKAAISHYQYSEEEFLHMTILDIRPEEEIENIKIVVNKSRLQNQSAYTIRTKHRKKNGEIIVVDVYGTPIVIGEKDFRAIISIDITDKVRHEEKIIEAILKTQEEERYEIGGELHDNVCQVIAAGQMAVDQLQGSLPTAKLAWFNKSKEFLALALTEIRNLSHRLAPVFFDDSTLEEAFRKLLHSFNMDDRYILDFQVGESVNLYQIRVEVQLNLYRILQEQLRNIDKYARASHIYVNVIIHDQQLVMSIADNGLGTIIETGKEGIGLANMRRRAALFSGKFDMQSSPGNGYKITIGIPLQKIILIN